MSLENVLSNDWAFLKVDREDRILIVRFEREDSPVNPLSTALLRELTELAQALEDDYELSAIVLTGKPDVFSAGFDLKESTSRAKTGLAERRIQTKVGPRLCKAWENIECMTFAAIEGHCIGGGFALAVACDIRISGQGAHFYVPEIERGMNMSWQSVPRTVALIGPAKTKRLFVMAEDISAEKAMDWGLIDEITPDGEAMDFAMAMARRVAALPPVSVRMCKEGINAASTAMANAVSVMDRDQFLLAQTGDDFAEGVRAFKEKRDPEFTGR